MAEGSVVRGFDAGDLALVSARLRAFGLPGEARLGPVARGRLAVLVESSAADARPPLVSPYRWRRVLVNPLKVVMRKLVWSRTGPALERQAEFNVALIRVAAEVLSSLSDPSDPSHTQRSSVSRSGG